MVFDTRANKNLFMNILKFDSMKTALTFNYYSNVWKI